MMSGIQQNIEESQILRLSSKVKALEELFALQSAELVREKQRVVDLEEQLEEAIKQSIYDPLTGLVTRREMERQIFLHFASLERAEKMTKQGRAQTTEVEEFSILVLDLNGLKTVNDLFGHKAGDTLLETFASILRGHFSRGTDIPCRWGGDEFVVLLGGVTPHAKAQKIAERFLEDLSSVILHFPLENTSGNTLHPVPVRTAIGVASTSDGFRTVKEIFDAADIAMYMHKKASKEGRE